MTRQACGKDCSILLPGTRYPSCMQVSLIDVGLVNSHKRITYVTTSCGFSERSYIKSQGDLTCLLPKTNIKHFPNRFSHNFLKMKMRQIHRSCEIASTKMLILKKMFRVGYNKDESWAHQCHKMSWSWNQILLGVLEYKLPLVILQVHKNDQWNSRIPAMFIYYHMEYMLLSSGDTMFLPTLTHTQVETEG